MAEIPEIFDAQRIELIGDSRDGFTGDTQHSHDRLLLFAKSAQGGDILYHNPVNSGADFERRAVKNADQLKTMGLKGHMGSDCLAQVPGADQNSLIA